MPEFELGGKKVSEAQFLAGLPGAIADGIAANVAPQIEAVLADLRCDEHPEAGAPKSSVHPDVESGQIEFRVEACCEAMKERALARIAEKIS
jgi:hypothetical protein